MLHVSRSQYRELLAKQGWLDTHCSTQTTFTALDPNVQRQNSAHCFPPRCNCCSGGLKENPEQRGIWHRVLGVGIEATTKLSVHVTAPVRSTPLNLLWEHGFSFSQRCLVITPALLCRPQHYQSRPNFSSQSCIYVSDRGYLAVEWQRQSSVPTRCDTCHADEL